MGLFTIAVKTMYLAVVHLALKQIGFDASLGQSLCCARSCRASSNDSDPQGAIEGSTILDSEHRQAALLGSLGCAPVHHQGCSRDAAAARSDVGTVVCLENIFGHGDGLCMAGESLRQHGAVGEHAGESHACP